MKLTRSGYTFLSKPGKTVGSCTNYKRVTTPGKGFEVFFSVKWYVKIEGNFENQDQIEIVLIEYNIIEQIMLPFLV